MKWSFQNKKLVWEIVFQIILHAMVFVFYAFDRDGWGEKHQVESYEVYFFLNYALAAAILNYLLFPKLLYPKKYLAFAGALMLLLAFVMLIEEGVLEQIFFPDTRGSHFPGVFRSLIDLLPTITILTGFKFAWDAITKEKELQELQSLITESELQFLKSQINPHFLFNNLNNIYALALESSPKTPTILLKLSGVLRYMLYEAQDKFVPLKHEIEQLENFIELSELQIEERGSLSWEKEIEASEFKIAPLILSVFIENAFKHSLASLSDNLKIEAKLTVNAEGQLNFECRNRKGPESNTQNIEGGIGLQNVRKRLELLYPNRHKLEILDAADLFELKLHLELSQD